MRNYILLIFAFLSLILAGCHYGEKPEWNTRLLLPLVNSSLDISKILQDSFIYKNSDSSVTLVYRTTFEDLTMDTLLKIPDTTLGYTYKLNSITLGVRTIEHDINLGQVARQGGIIGFAILMSQGKNMAVPALSGIKTGKIDIDATYLFKTVNVQEGYITMKVHNGFPIELTNAIFRLVDKLNSNIILQDTIATLQPGATFVKDYNLNGKNFSGSLYAEILNISSPGTDSTTVLIDTNDMLNISLVLAINKLNSATAIFPTQNLVDMNDDVLYHLNGPRLTKMNVKTGSFKIKLASTLQDTAYVTYFLPEAKYMGITPLLVHEKSPPAPPGQSVYIEKTYSVDNYYYDLTGKFHNSTNSFWNVLTMRIDSNGRMVTLSLTDSFYVYYSLYSVIPSYLEGYMGEQKFHAGPATFNNGAFSHLVNGSISLKDVNVKLFIENGIGAPGKLTINKLEGDNSRSGKSKILDLSKVGNVMNIPAGKNNPPVPYYFEREINTKNSNIKDFIENLPDIINYDLDVVINPENDTNDLSQFIYNTSSVKVGLDIELPVEFSASGLTMVDTQKFDLASIKSLNQVTNGIFIINTLNGFPMNVHVSLVFIDPYDAHLDSLDAGYITGAKVNPLTGRVKSPVNYTNEVMVSEEKMNHLKHSNRVIIKATLNTINSPDKVKIYSDYKLNFKLSANMNYQPKF